VADEAILAIENFPTVAALGFSVLSSRPCALWNEQPKLNLEKTAFTTYSGWGSEFRNSMSSP
jgi:hypothetical protein